MYRVYRACGEKTIWLDLMITTEYEYVAIDYAQKCPNPIHSPALIQAMVVIYPDGKTQSFPMKWEENL